MHVLNIASAKARAKTVFGHLKVKNTKSKSHLVQAAMLGSPHKAELTKRQTFSCPGVKNCWTCETNFPTTLIPYAIHLFMVDSFSRAVCNRELTKVCAMSHQSQNYIDNTVQIYYLTAEEKLKLVSSPNVK